MYCCYLHFFFHSFDCCTVFVRCTEWTRRSLCQKFIYKYNTHTHTDSFFVLNFNNNNNDDIVSKLLLFCQQLFTSIHTGGGGNSKSNNPLPSSQSSYQCDVTLSFVLRSVPSRHLIPGTLFSIVWKERCWCNQQFTMFIWIRMWHPFCHIHTVHFTLCCMVSCIYERMTRS